MKLCWLINDDGWIVSWAWATANVHDQVFLPLVSALEDESIVLADTGFNDADGIPANLKLCPRGTWNERMLVETALSLVTTVCSLKKVFHRTSAQFETRLAYVAAMSRCCLDLIAPYNRTLVLRIACIISPSMPSELAPSVTSTAIHWSLDGFQSVRLACATFSLASNRA